MKSLLVGAGAMGKTWAQNLRDCEDVELAAWIDIAPDRAAQVADELSLSIPYTGSDLGKALAEVRPDFVVDVTIPEAHRDVTLQALAAGIPVLGEKPMADSMEHAREMVAASEKAGKLYMVSQSRRYDARIQAFRQLILNHIGPLGILNSDFYIGAHFGGFRDEMPSPLLLDMAIHTLDAARFLSGADPISVYCEEFNPSWSWYKGNACATAVYEMTGGLRYTYRGSWCSEGIHTSWEGEWRAVGPKGTAVWDGNGVPVAKTVQKSEGFYSTFQRYEPVLQEGVHSAIAGSLREFLWALETGNTPNGECHDNIKSLAMVFSAIESAKTGRRVSIQWEQ
jgi:predicted dehydrogenase